MAKKRFLEGLEQISDGRYKLIETVTLDSSRYSKLSLTENTKIVEAHGENYPVRSAYEFKIWDNNFNLNGRNYGRVIEKVIQENAITLGFTNHPKDGEEDVNQFEIIEARDENKIAIQAIQAVHNGQAEIVLKGKVRTPVLLKAAFDSKTGLRTGRIISDVFVCEYNERSGKNKLPKKFRRHHQGLLTPEIISDQNRIQFPLCGFIKDFIGLQIKIEYFVNHHLKHLRFRHHLHQCRFHAKGGAGILKMG